LYNYNQIVKNFLSFYVSNKIKKIKKENNKNGNRFSRLQMENYI